MITEPPAAEALAAIIGTIAVELRGIALDPEASPRITTALQRVVEQIETAVAAWEGECS